MTAAPEVPRVLIVDDRRDNRLALSAVLEALQVEIVEAASGEEALSQLLEGDFAVVVLDVQMPVVDGFETARLIKARERTRHLPIIFLTAISGDPEHFLEGYRSGAVDYIYKPFQPEFLRAKVSVFCELWRRGRVIADQRQRLAEQLAQVQHLNAELERSNAALEGFAAIAAEQLQEPLANVAGMLELASTASDPQLIDRARAAAGRLQERVAALLDVSQVGAVPLHVEDVALGEVVAEALSGVTLKDVSVDVLPTVRGDRAQLVRLFELLFDNCARYAGTGARVRVGVDGPAVTVCDDGPGIDPAARPGVFTLFGTGPGVGLPICRRIVERHGGTIWVEPTVDGGTTIAFTLPGIGTG